MIKTGYSTIIQSEKGHGVSPAMHQHPRQSRISMIRSFCFAFGISFGGISLGVVYYELKPNETMTGDRY